MWVLEVSVLSGAESYSGEPKVSINKKKPNQKKYLKCQDLYLKYIYPLAFTGL